MILQVPWASPGFSLIVWGGLFLGILHTIMPCEDKFIFCFYAFGVARDWKQAFRIVNFYGAGLFLMNLAIGTIISYFAALAGNLIREYRFIWNGAAGLVMILSGIIMLVQLKRKTYWPHSDQLQELTESLGTLRAKKRTGFLLGLLAGIPPCIFEGAVYIQTALNSASYGWGNGAWTVFFFGIGTWIGLYPLALVGTASGKLAKAMQGSSMQKIQERMKRKRNSKHDLQVNAEEKEPSIPEENRKIANSSKIEYISGVIMMLFGLVFLVLALFGIDLIPPSNVPQLPWPF